MNVLIYLFTVLVVQAVALLIYRCLLSRKSLGKIKRAYLIVALAMSFALPLVQTDWLVLPLEVPSSVSTNEQLFGGLNSYNGESHAGALSTETETSALFTPSASQAIGPYHTGGELWRESLLILYCCGLLFFGWRFGRSLARMLKQREEAIRTERVGEATIYFLPYPTTAHTFGLWIFVGANAFFPSAVRLHELAHVSQRHSYDRVAIAILRIIWWWNPLLFLYERAIIQNHELLADRAVIEAGVPIRQYQAQLLSALSRKPYLTVLSSGLPYSFTKNRFLMLYNSTPGVAKRRRILVNVMASWLVLILGVTAVSCDSPSADEAAIATPKPITATSEPEVISAPTNSSATIEDEAATTAKATAAQRVASAPPVIEPAPVPPAPPKVPAGRTTPLTDDEFQRLPHPRSPMSPPAGVPGSMLMGEYIDRWVAEERRRKPGSSPRTNWPNFARKRTVAHQWEMMKNPPAPPPTIPGPNTPRTMTMREFYRREKVRMQKEYPQYVGRDFSFWEDQLREDGLLEVTVGEYMARKWGVKSSPSE